MNPITSLKYLPIKSSLQKKLPEEVIYQFSSTKENYMLQDVFMMFKTKQPGKKCYMKCYPDLVERSDKNGMVSSLYVHKLLSLYRRIGLGTKMLDFAQVYSKKKGCNGYFHLSANAGYMPNSIPQIFYGKYGMNTESKSINNKIRKYVKNNKDATYNDIPNVTMFYPPIKFETWYDKIKNFFTSLGK